MGNSLLEMSNNQSKYLLTVPTYAKTVPVRKNSSHKKFCSHTIHLVKGEKVFSPASYYSPPSTYHLPAFPRHTPTTPSRPDNASSHPGHNLVIFFDYSFFDQFFFPQNTFSFPFSVPPWLAFTHFCPDQCISQKNLLSSSQALLLHPSTYCYQRNLL